MPIKKSFCFVLYPKKTVLGKEKRIKRISIQDLPFFLLTKGLKCKFTEEKNTFFLKKTNHLCKDLPGEQAPSLGQ